MRFATPRTFAFASFLPVVFSLPLARPTHAVPVSYAVNYTTTKGNPVTHILILETDGATPVRATIYGSDLPGSGTSVISHDAPFVPKLSLVIGLTEGCDAEGNDQTQLVMFLDDDFAAVNEGVNFSAVFPGARHSTTIANLEAAVAGDTGQLAWFTDTFFHGPAAGAAFDPRGSFTIAGFTALKTIGKSATAGSWMVTSFQSLPNNDPNAQSNRVTAAIDETAKRDNGPFDCKLTIDGDGVFAIDKTVVNETGTDWARFIMELGTGLGVSFVPSAGGDGLGFSSSDDNREETGAFPEVMIGEDRIVFTGFLAAGGTARFIVFVGTDVPSPHMITVRQKAIVARVAAPAMRPWAAAVAVLLLCLIAGFRSRVTRA
jgi:hypothetical protein